jgi:hypothetical protein
MVDGNFKEVRKSLKEINGETVEPHQAFCQSHECIERFTAHRLVPLN